MLRATPAALPSELVLIGSILTALARMKVKGSLWSTSSTPTSRSLELSAVWALKRNWFDLFAFRSPEALTDAIGTAECARGL